MNPTMRNTDAMQPCYPDVTNGSDHRNRDGYLAALRQFDVEYNPRYAQRNGNTYCNIFLWDGSRALGCEIPHFKLYYQSGQLTGKELNANAVCEWFAGTEDDLAGWKAVDASWARQRAAIGFPTVVTWRNPGGTGHVAWVIPSARPNISIAQAGATNFFDGPLERGFGNASPLLYYTHE